MGELDEGKVKALQELGQDEATITELAEKQKAVEPEEETIVEKSQGDDLSILDRLKQLLGIKDEPPAAQAEEPVAAEKSEEVEPQVEAPLEEQIKGLGATIVGQTTKALQDALAPMAEEIAQIKATQAQYDPVLEMIVKNKEELVMDRLAELPQVVKVAASEVEATRTDEDPEPTEKAEGYVPELWETITKSVNEALQKVERGYKV
jgi:hypothetical protein